MEEPQVEAMEEPLGTLKSYEAFKCNHCLDLLGDHVYRCNTDYRMCLCLSCYRKEKAKGRSGVAATAKGCKLREKATKTIEVKCSYMKHGCDKEGLTLCQKRNHEYSCTYRPYGCPVPGCGFKGPFLYDHIHQHHVESKDAFSFKKSATLTLYPSGKLAWVLLERNSSRIILLQLINCAGGNEPPHHSLRVLTFGPPPEQALNFTMEIGALLARKPVRVKLSATMVWRRSLEEPIMAEEVPFIIPDCYWSASRSIMVTICLE